MIKYTCIYDFLNRFLVRRIIPCNNNTSTRFTLFSKFIIKCWNVHKRWNMYLFCNVLVFFYCPNSIHLHNNTFVTTYVTACCIQHTILLATRCLEIIITIMKHLFLHNKPTLSYMQLSERQQLSMTCCVNTQHHNNNNTIQIHVRFTNIMHTSCKINKRN